MSLPLTRQQAIDLVATHITNKGLLKHCLAVGVAMRALADHFHEDPDLWEVIGILHDADWEETKDAVHEHTRKTVQWVKELSNEPGSESTAFIIRTILAHNYHNNNEPAPSNVCEWALSCCDELTGIIVANALIMPSRKLADISPESVIKKMNTKSFAAAVDRSGILLCEEKLGIKLIDFVSIVLRGMQKSADELGL